jgi:hypothetical protein
MPTNTVHGQGLGNNQYSNVQYQNYWGQAPKPTTQNQPIIPRAQMQQTGKLYSYRTSESEYGREKSPRVMGRPKSPRDPNNYNTKKVTGNFDLESMTNEQADMYFQQIDQDMRQKPKGPTKKPDSAPKVHANFNAADYFFDEPFEKDKVVCDQDWLNQSTLDNYFPANPAPSDKKSKREHADVFQSGLFEAKIPTYKPRKTEDDKPVVDRYAIKEVSEDEDSFNFSDDQYNPALPTTDSYILEHENQDTKSNSPRAPDSKKGSKDDSNLLEFLNLVAKNTKPQGQTDAKPQIQPETKPANVIPTRPRDLKPTPAIQVAPIKPAPKPSPAGKIDVIKPRDRGGKNNWMLKSFIPTGPVKIERGSLLSSVAFVGSASRFNALVNSLVKTNGR